MRAKLNEQLKKNFNSDLKGVADTLYGEWVPILEETKKKHTLVERVSNLVSQLENGLADFEQRAQQTQDDLKKLQLVIVLFVNAFFFF